MTQIKIDPISYFIKSRDNFPIKSQENIMDAMDSCQYTIIPNKRCFGITTAIQSYIEWEFLFSNIPVKTDYVVHDRHSADYAFYNLSKFRENRYTYRCNNSIISIDTMQQLFRVNRFKGLIPSDVYVFDNDVYNCSYKSELYKLIDVCNSYIGKNTHLQYIKSDYINDNNHNSPIYTFSRAYNGSRFVVICDNPTDMANSLLRNGVDEDQIGIVDMSNGGLQYRHHS